MRRYVAIITNRDCSRYGVDYTNTVYRVKNNNLIFIGDEGYNSQMYNGHDSMAYKIIVDNKKESKAEYTRRDGCYVVHKEALPFSISLINL